MRFVGFAHTVKLFLEKRGGATVVYEGGGAAVVVVVLVVAGKLPVQFVGFQPGGRVVAVRKHGLPRFGVVAQIVHVPVKAFGEAF